MNGSRDVRVYAAACVVFLALLAVSLWQLSGATASDGWAAVGTLW